jgi:hypothetical protein
MNLSREKLITLSIAVAVFFVSLGFTAYNIKGDDIFKSTASEITGFGAALANKK